MSGHPTVVVGDPEAKKMLKDYRDVDEKYDFNSHEFLNLCATHLVIALMEDYTSVRQDGDLEKAKKYVRNAIPALIDRILLDTENTKSVAMPAVPSEGRVN